MAPKVSSYIKQRIVSLYKNKRSYNEICRIIFSEEKFKVSRQAVSFIIRKYNTTRTTANRLKSGRPSTVTLEMLDFIDNAMEEDDELTSYSMFVLFVYLHRLSSHKL